MSYVQNIILVGTLEEVDNRLNAINDAIQGQDTIMGGSPGLVLLNRTPNSYGGAKHLETDIAVGAFNYLDVSKFIDDLKDIFQDADRFTSVQLFHQDQNEDEFTVVSIRHYGA